MDEYISVPEAAKLLGISRIAVYKKIKSGKIKAKKAGRNYIIKKDDIAGIYQDKLSEKQKKEIDAAVKKTIKEYGETLKKLKET